MQITESQLRRYVSLLLKEAKRSPNTLLVLEGPEIDRVQLIKKFPDKSTDISGLPPKWITWLSDRFGAAPKRTETHPLSDALPTVKLFSTKEAGISQKWKSNEQFKTSVLNDELFAGAGASFSPADPTKLTIDQLERLLALSERKKQRFDVDSGLSPVEADRVGKVGRWNIWMPTTRENSCKIAGYDPVTMKEKTTWCTARMSGSNLFYNYTGRTGSEITLFYIIADNPKLNSDWLSVGFVNGTPKLSGKDGDLSVDRSNKGLTEQSLRKILGSDHDKIMQTMTEKNESLDGRHPSRDKIKAAAQSVDALQDLVRGLSEEEESDLFSFVLSEEKVSAEVFAHLANHKSELIRTHVAKNSNIPTEISVKLCNDVSERVRRAIAGNASASAEALAKLSKDESITIQKNVANNTSAPLEVLVQLARSKNSEIRDYVAKNPNAPVEVLTQLARDESTSVRHYVAKNPNAPVEVLTQLARDGDLSVRQSIALIPNTPADALAQLARDEDKIVLWRVSENPNTPADALAQLARDKDQYVRHYVAKNPNAPVEVLTQLARDESTSVRRPVASNPNAPVEVLAQLARDTGEYVRYYVASNPNAPVEVLTQLAKDKDTGVRRSVASNPNAPVEVLAQLAKDKDTNVCRAVALNSNTPADALVRLAKNKNEGVRNYALKTLQSRQQLAELKQLIKYLI